MKNETNETVIQSEQRKSQPIIRFLAKTVQIKETSLSGKIMNKIGIAREEIILVPEYMLDENDNIAYEINYDLVPEDQKELVRELGVICLRHSEKSGREFVEPIFDANELESLRNGKQTDYGFESKTWEQFAERFLKPFISDKKSYISGLTINDVPECTTVTRTGITGDAKTVDERRQIIKLSCLVVAVLIACGMVLNAVINDYENNSNLKQWLDYKLTDPMSNPNIYLPFSR